MDARAVLADSTVRVRPGTFAVVKSRRPDPGAFASIDDGNDITVVVESGTYDPEDAIAVEDGWRLLTFDVVLPFDLVGFLAEVAGVLADADISIFALSAYSTDHVLVKATDLEPAVARLEELGCTVEREDHSSTGQ